MAGPRAGQAQWPPSRWGSQHPSPTRGSELRLQREGLAPCCPANCRAGRHPELRPNGHLRPQPLALRPPAVPRRTVVAPFEMRPTGSPTLASQGLPGGQEGAGGLSGCAPRVPGHHTALGTGSLPSGREGHFKAHLQGTDRSQESTYCLFQWWPSYLMRTQHTPGSAPGSCGPTHSRAALRLCGFQDPEGASGAPSPAAHLGRNRPVP